MAKTSITEGEVAVLDVPLSPPTGVALKKVSVSDFGQKLAVLEGMAEVFASHGLTASDMLVEGYKGDSVLVTAPQKGDVPEVTIYITSINKPFLMAALAALPQYRARFTEIVAEKVREGRKSAEYQSILEGIADLQAQMGEAIASARAASKEYAKPFDAGLFIDEGSIVEVRGKTAPGVGNSGGNGKRTRTPSQTKWNLPRYKHPRLVENVQYWLTHEGPRWHVEDEVGTVYAEGETANEATRVWYDQRGMGINISAPAAWGAAAQELEAEAAAAAS